MKTTISQQALLACCMLSFLTTPSAFSSTADFLNALNGLELASNTIQSIPGASTATTTKAQGIASFIANSVCAIAADPTIAGSNFAAINSFLNAQISTQPSLTSTVDTVRATIPPALFKQAQVFYSIANNTRFC